MINKRRAFIVGIKSLQLSKNEIDFLKKYKPWGVILFLRNIKSIKQAKSLTDNIRKIFKDKNYPILIDQEGGRVNRLSNIISFDNLTSEYFGKLYEKDKMKLNIIYKLFIDNISHLLKLIGANINTLPVLDLRVKGASNIIGDRSFSSNVSTVSKMGDLCIKLFKENSIGTVIKHIPGHGLAKVDSHNFTPIVNKSIKHLKKYDFSTFKKKNCFFAMTGHVIYKNLDQLNTVTHSKKVIRYIRNYIGFKNILISDDLSMKSLKNNMKNNTIKAFEAGCNLALHCNGKLNEMKIVAENSPLISSFISKKTSQFYKILS
ncbi:glycoside hydrolase family 3 N-terminal domain-containing protein [Candidatus Pelagibacter bacterium nBUS_49]|uniref:glycoside hydrolase family 3 N-terminal domain-containing protein n=1 Tax=Candidatus Pelagibacter bacterium nBUS_49 TaxID=3374196 RepID=UPI003EB9525D